MKWYFRILLFILLATIIWLPLYFLPDLKDTVESIVLAASITTILLLFLIFSDSAKDYVERITRISVAGIEIDLKAVLSESVSALPDQSIFISLDRRTFYNKSGLQEFMGLVRNHLGRPKSRIVLTVDLFNPNRIDIPMLFFQASYLQDNFDLRAFLFKDSSRSNKREQVLGTITPSAGLSIMDDDQFTLRCAYVKAINEFSVEALNITDNESILELWSMYSNYIEDYSGQRNLDIRFFHNQFRNFIEANFIEHPISKDQFPAFLSYLVADYKHIMIMKDGELISVRTINRIIREILIRILRGYIENTDD